MGKLRRNGTDDFPVESRSDGMNYILVHEPEEKTRYVRDDDGNHTRTTVMERFTHYKATKTEKTKLLKKLQEMEDYDDVELLGVWQGQYGSDTFVLELPRFVQRMESADL